MIPADRTFEEQLDYIAALTETIRNLRQARETAIADADGMDPRADRRKICHAAGLFPSSLYRILEKNGRPRVRE